MELKRLVKNEKCDKKKKNIALKATDVKDVELEDVDLQSESDEYMNLTFHKFNLFLRH